MLGRSACWPTLQRMKMHMCERGASVAKYTSLGAVGTSIQPIDVRCISRSTSSLPASLVVNESAASTAVPDDPGEDVALSAPREGTSSAPIPRRKLRQAESKAHSNTPRGSRTESRGEGRLWRERLASTKALLGVGTEAACKEVHGRERVGPTLPIMMQPCLSLPVACCKEWCAR